MASRFFCCTPYEALVLYQYHQYYQLATLRRYVRKKWQSEGPMSSPEWEILFGHKQMDAPSRYYSPCLWLSRRAVQLLVHHKPDSCNPFEDQLEKDGVRLVASKYICRSFCIIWIFSLHLLPFFRLYLHFKFLAYFSPR